MFSKKIIVPTIIAVLLIAGISAFAINSENTRTEQKKSDEKVAMMKKTEESTMTKSEAMMSKSETTMIKSDDMMSKAETVMTKKGSYLPYASDFLKNAENGSVVLFFNAVWCPTCQSTVKDLNSKIDKIPSNLTVLSADYDKETSLKQKYGVTMQHTFVKVDKDGNLLKKANGLENLEAIVNFVK